MLLKAGYAPINPASDWNALKRGGLSRALLEKDEALVAISDAVFQLDGWGDSPGARQEAKWAEKYGKPCAWTLTRLHKVLKDWGEGASGQLGSGGDGFPAATGDATWLHTFYDTDLWQTPGGDFAPLASAVIPVGAPGRYVFASTPDLVADVWEWLEDPASNHGWILVGSEDRRQTARSFASRESPVPGGHRDSII